MIEYVELYEVYVYPRIDRNRILVECESENYIISMYIYLNELKDYVLYLRMVSWT